jgi:hypothetical protein
MHKEPRVSTQVGFYRSVLSLLLLRMSPEVALLVSLRLSSQLLPSNSRLHTCSFPVLILGSAISLGTDAQLKGFGAYVSGNMTMMLITYVGEGKRQDANITLHFSIAHNRPRFSISIPPPALPLCAYKYDPAF